MKTWVLLYILVFSSDPPVVAKPVLYQARPAQHPQVQTEPDSGQSQALSQALSQVFLEGADD